MRNSLVINDFLKNTKRKTLGMIYGRTREDIFVSHKLKFSISQLEKKEKKNLETEMS